MKYVCTVCGYVYDEEAGDPDRNIPAEDRKSTRLNSSHAI